MDEKKFVSNFELLADLNVNEHVETKKTGQTELSYLSWAWAWKYFKTQRPDANYTVKHWDGKPYLFDERLGYMVETSITTGGETHEMWLPVMDGANHAMLDKPYVVKTKYSEFNVPAATMFDINKTIMRCLVKNMAMFGLGLYIYAGEDLPNDDDEQVEIKKSTVEDVVAGMEKMTLDNWKGFYKKAIDLYPKETAEYKVWIAAFNSKKDALERGKTESQLAEDAEYLNTI